MSSPKTWYVEVILPLGVDGVYTYALPLAWTSSAAEPSAWIGRMLLVPLGKRKQYSALVWNITDSAPGFAVKEALEVLETMPVWGAKGQELWAWLMDYYFAAPGAVMLAGLPAMLRVSSESIFVGLPLQDGQDSVLTDSLPPLTLSLWRHLLQGQGHSLDALSAWMKPHSPMPFLKDLLAADLASIQESLTGAFRPKMERTYMVHPSWWERISELIAKLEKSPKHLEIILALMALSSRHEPVRLSDLKGKLNWDRIPYGALKTLTDKGFLDKANHAVSRIRLRSGRCLPLQCTTAQEQAVEACRLSFAQGKPVLLHGVTGSGKTMVYLALIRDALARGQQVLYLVPEIALTHQLVNRLAEYVDTEVGVYHSRYSDSERVELWNGVRDGSISMVVAPRSGIFLPLVRWGLIVVDEEHDASYKQQDKAPYYQAKDVALWMGGRWGIPVILGSATPSPESWAACMRSKITKVTLNSRFADQPLPVWQWVDTIAERLAGKMQGEFSTTLLEAIRHELKQGNQVILFKNRRGYAPQLTCEDCAWSARCDQCDLALVYHKWEHRLRCHGCAQIFGMPPACVSCGSTRLKFKGYGTEKIEEELQLLLEGYTIGRLDQDSVRSKSAYSRTLDAFEKGQIQVLVGTQMVSKGLDFPLVNLVGVLDADQGLNRTHFRAQERSYQLLAQLAGRSGRHQGTGTVLLQTRMPHHPLFALLQAQDYASFMDQELLFREQHLYPPFVRLIRLTLGHAQAQVLQKSADTLALWWRPWLGTRLIGPAPPMTALLRNEYRLEMWIKAEKDPHILRKIRDSLPPSLHQLSLIREYKGLRMSLDVDPE